ncbi:MAG: DNA cytosine methyltransferase [Chloroflexaceae bacterium]|nr:DNA cytosine methyltransferase [Chloroflexaceae bacterium]
MALSSGSKHRLFTVNRPIAVDLFAGAGGMSLGFEMAGFDVLAALEIDPVHCATYQFNFPFTSVLCQDIRSITGRALRERSAIADREIDVVIGGAPCQGFSIIGKRDPGDRRNTLMFEFARLVGELQPKYFVLENVPRFAQHQALLQALLAQFSQHYQVCEPWQILNAASFGVPQARKRLFLMGSRRGLPLPRYPQPVSLPASPKPRCRRGQLPMSPTVAEALADLPQVENYPELWHQDRAIAEYGLPSDYARPLRGLVRLGDDYSYGRCSQPELLTCSWLTQHTAVSMARFAATTPGQREKISHFDRLNWQGVSVTLRAGTDGQRGAFTAARPIHPELPRCITVREAARLHSYPDWFRFHWTKWHGFRQVGNSVPPLMAKAIAQEILLVLNREAVQPQGVQSLGDEELLYLTVREAAQRLAIHPEI